MVGRSVEVPLISRREKPEPYQALPKALRSDRLHKEIVMRVVNAELRNQSSEGSSAWALCSNVGKLNRWLALNRIDRRKMTSSSIKDSEVWLTKPAACPVCCEKLIDIAEAT